MFDIIRDSVFGNLVNYLSGGRLLPYPDQKLGYVIPPRYLVGSISSASEPATRVPSRDEKNLYVTPSKSSVPTENPSALEDGSRVTQTSEKSEPVDPFVVRWDGDDDPDNPLNWSIPKRTFVHIAVSYLTFSVYIGAPIFTASIPGLMQDWGISSVVGTLGLSMYVLAYGMGPMVLAPLQEIPSLGRNPVYIGCLFIFALLQIPTALARNIGSLVVLRFISGFFASPALATGGASIVDIYPPNLVPYAIGLWSLAGTCGPTLGPLIGGFLAQAGGWQWPIWTLLCLSGAACVSCFFLLPETLEDTILLKRARRLRKLTGNPQLRSLSEIKQAHLTPKGVALEALVRPFQLMTEPAVFFLNLYLALAYAVLFLWFEAFPIVFMEVYHMDQGNSGLAFLGLVVGTWSAFGGYCLYIRYYVTPKWIRQGFLAPEEHLDLSAFAGFLIPISLFIFGWTSRASVHWMVPIVGAGIFMPGLFLLFQSVLVYLPISYPKYAASVLAGNDFVRSSAAAAFPLFGRAFFKNLGLGPACSILGGITLLMMPFLWLIRIKGAKLRAMSKYATAST